MITKENVDLLLAHSRQTKLTICDNRFIDRETIERANQKMKENRKISINRVIYEINMIGKKEYYAILWVSTTRRI